MASSEQYPSERELLLFILLGIGGSSVKRRSSVGNHHVLSSIYFIICTHTHSTQKKSTIHPISPTNSSYIFLTIYLSSILHTHLYPKIPHFLHISHNKIKTGTSVKYPMPYVPNSPVVMAVSRRRRMNVVRKSYPTKHYSLSTFTRKLPSVKIYKCYSNPMVNSSVSI